jgi:hypothetical protein
MRLHNLTEDLLPLLGEASEGADAWERLVDALIGVALRNRRLIELNLRNQEAIAALHQHPTLGKHGQLLQQHEVQAYFLGVLQDAALPIEQRVRKMASLGAVMGVLLAANAFADAPDAALESALRGAVHDLLSGRPG